MAWVLIAILWGLAIAGALIVLLDGDYTKEAD